MHGVAKRVLFIGAAVVAVLLGTATAGLAARPLVARAYAVTPTVLESFEPNGVVPGAWTETAEPRQLPIGDQIDEPCTGTIRVWKREDAIRLGLGWFSCDSETMSTALRARGWARLTQRQLNGRTVLADAEHVTRHSSDTVGRSWQENGYEIEVLCTGPEQTCLILTGTVVQTISNVLPGEPVPAQVIPRGSAIIGSFLLYWLLFIGLPMLGGYMGSGSYNNGPPRPTVTPVDAAAARLRRRQRGRRVGTVLVAIGLIVTTTHLLAVATQEVAPYVAGLITAAVLVTAGSILIRLCRHPQLTARWLRYRWHLGRHTTRRLGSAVLTVLVGLIAATGPVIAILSLFFLSLLGFGEDTGNVLAGLVFAGAGGGALLDILARRLRARTAREAIQDEIKNGRQRILYLRNFGDDQVKLPTSALTRRGLFATLVAPVNPLRKARFEELLGRAMGRWGAVVGLGQPGLTLPTLGVAKTEPVGDTWRQQVREHAAEAYAVVVSATPAALGRGLKWELDYLAHTAPHGRIVLVLGPQSGKATPAQRFSSFLTVTECYELFNPLGQGWIPDGALVLIHVPADGSWHAWTAQRRNAWTYTAAIDEAFEFAEREWSKPAQSANAPATRPFVESVRLALDDAGKAALAAGRTAEPAEAAPIDTRHIMAALMRRHPLAQWHRINPAGPDALESTPGSDADPEPGGYWRGVPLTGTAHAAVLSAMRISRTYRLHPAPAGILALATITEPGSGAAQTLSVLGASTTQDLATAIQHDLLGTTLIGFTQMAPSPPIHARVATTPQAAPLLGGPKPPSPAGSAQPPSPVAGIQPPLPVVAPATPALPQRRLRPATFLSTALIVFIFGFAPINAATEEPTSTIIQMIAYGLILGPVFLWAAAYRFSGRRYAWIFCASGTLLIAMLHIVAVTRVTGN